MGTYNGYYKINAVDLIDVFYPVGTIYETKDANFNPNTTWGGTWNKIEDKFLVAAGSTYTGTGGAASQSITLSTSNLPSHRHSFTPSGSVSSSFSGNNFSGTADTYANQAQNSTAGEGVFSGSSWHSYNYSLSGGSDRLKGKRISFSMTPSGSVSSSFSGTADNTGYKGDGAAFTVNTVPPYQAVYIWERTV